MFLGWLECVWFLCKLPVNDCLLFRNTATDQNDKKFCSPQQCDNTTLDESSDATLFQLLALSNSPLTVSKLANDEKLSTFTNLLNKITKEQNEVEEVSTMCEFRRDFNVQHAPT